MTITFWQIVVLIYCFFAYYEHSKKRVEQKTVDGVALVDLTFPFAPIWIPLVGLAMLIHPPKDN